MAEISDRPPLMRGGHVRRGDRDNLTAESGADLNVVYGYRVFKKVTAGIVRTWKSEILMLSSAQFGRELDKDGCGQNRTITRLLHANIL